MKFMRTNDSVRTVKPRGYGTCQCKQCASLSNRLSPTLDTFGLFAALSNRLRQSAASGIGTSLEVSAGLGRWRLLMRRPGARCPVWQRNLGKCAGETPPVAFSV
ncbi:hypothetical protein BRAS3843_720023 [Bradyrhizobium sp. STM 3843]|nr:hypothetical protein BRAS3843_720023 [Bradyrhizobium sp. STM 3843]